MPAASSFPDFPVISNHLAHRSSSWEPQPGMHDTSVSLSPKRTRNSRVEGCRGRVIVWDAPRRFAVLELLRPRCRAAVGSPAKQLHALMPLGRPGETDPHCALRTRPTRASRQSYLYEAPRYMMHQIHDQRSIESSESIPSGGLRYIADEPRPTRVVAGRDGLGRTRFPAPDALSVNS
jgi:hypothetical protein